MPALCADLATNSRHKRGVPTDDQVHHRSWLVLPASQCVDRDAPVLAAFSNPDIPNRVASKGDDALAFVVEADRSSVNGEPIRRCATAPHGDVTERASGIEEKADPQSRHDRAVHEDVAHQHCHQEDWSNDGRQDSEHELPRAWPTAILPAIEDHHPMGERHAALRAAARMAGTAKIVVAPHAADRPWRMATHC